MTRINFPVRLLLFAVVLLSVWGCMQQPSADKQTETDPTTRNFNYEWQFARDIDTTVSSAYFKQNGPVSWQKIALPHTAHIEPLVIKDQQWQGTAFYRKFFTLSDSDRGKHIALKFGAAMHEAHVYLNGRLLAHHKGGYLPFVVDITDSVRFDKPNVVLLKVNNEDNPVIPPGKPLGKLDFSYFSGLYRNAWLLVDNKLHISDPIAADRQAGGGVLVHYTGISDTAATIHVQTDIINKSGTSQGATLKLNLVDAEGKTVLGDESETKPVAAGSYGRFEQALELASPHLWSPDHPYLYTLRVELLNGGTVVDSKQMQIGVRSVAFNTDQQLLLNGKRVRLRGTNRHQSYPYIGYALSDNAQYRDARKIKEAGFNFIRSAHYPPSPAFLDACDKLGILFMDATPGWQFFGGKEFQQQSFQNIRDMVRRDRNHPSVIFWEASLNESNMDKAFMEKANALVHSELPFEGVFTVGWMDYAYDIFDPARQHAKPPAYWNHYDKEKPLLIAEYGDWEYYAQNAGFNQDEFEGLQKEARNSRQLRGDGQKRLAQQALNFQEAYNSNLQGPAIGDANWLMYDYNRGYTSNIEASGIRDIFRLPKFAYYFYRSQAGPNTGSGARFGKPMIFIANYWSDPSFTTVKVYSNTDEVELFLNGRSLGRHRPDSGRVDTHLQHPPFTFKPDQFEEGRLKAVGYINGKKRVETFRDTPGQPIGIQLDVDFSGKALQAREKDAVFVYASIVDQNGTVIPNAEAPVTFSITEGEGEIVGQNPIRAEAGIATTLLQAGNTPGKIVIRAEADGLRSAKQTIQVKN